MDTFVLVFQKGNYVITDPKRFKDYFYPINPNDKDQRIRFLQEQRGSRKYTQNPSLLYRNKGLVYPNLTIWERIRREKHICDLHASISIAKLLFGHSFGDVGNERKNESVDLLVNRLADMGIEVKKVNICNSWAQTIHYSTNIMFLSEEEARMFLERMYKCSLGEWFENNDKTFSNNGHAVRFHTDTFEIVFYLKYYDVLEKKNRSLDRHKTLQKQEIAEKAKKSGKIPPLVRMEIRMNGFRSIKTHFRAVFGIEKDRWTFDEVFDYIKNRKVLLYYWNKIIEKPENTIILSDWSNRDICLNVKEKYNNEKIKTIAEGMGLFYMLNSLGVKDLKAFVELRHNRQAWYRKRRMIASFAKQFTVPNKSLITTITRTLEKKSAQLHLPLT